MPRFYPFGFIPEEIKYFQEGNIGEHVDCHLAYCIRQWLLQGTAHKTPCQLLRPYGGRPSFYLQVLQGAPHELHRRAEEKIVRELYAAALSQLLHLLQLLT